ncbi:FtsX-like permease family protein [Kribbella sp. NPDC048915]|uniref:FtsX-like permease family protein n=1 Tax=Kribbella sp. NPDC048915 TaxID=3155148 RepID=UPI0033C80D4A
MFLRQALRYRWGQAAVLAGVSALIGTCAAFAPWFARAVQQTVTTETLQRQWTAATWQLAADPPTAVNGPAEPDPPDSLDQLVPGDLLPLFSPPVHGRTVGVVWGVGTQRPAVEGRLVWRGDYCAHVVLTAGRCPNAPGEVLASTADAQTFGTKVGATLRAVTTRWPEGGGLRVVGLYRADDTAAHWFGRGPTGHSRPASDSRPGLADHLLAEPSTFALGPWGYQATMDTRPLPGVARAADLDRIRQATDQLEGRIAELGLNARNNSGLIDVVDGIRAEQRQAVTIIPLVMVQVALFGVVVLVLALATVVDQRRSELAVARLRGSGAGAVGRALATELSVPVLGGIVLGAPVGFALLLVVRAAWLEGTAPLELPWTVPAAVAAAALVGLGAVVLSVRTVVRRPIAGLLRRIAPRGHRRTIGVVDLTVIVLASAGLVTGLTGGGRGPLPILTPTLLALATGLAFAHLLLPTAGLVSRRALRKGRLGLALGALQIARRPTMTRLVAVVAVATGLATFAGQAASVADRNRITRAGYETGAAAVLAVDTTGLGTFTAAIDKVDPDRKWLTPVVRTQPPSAENLRAVLIEPDSYRRIAFRGDRITDAEGFGKLRAPTEPGPIELNGGRLTATLDVGAVKASAPPPIDGIPVPPSNLAAASVILEATVVNQTTGTRYVVRLPPVPVTRNGPVAVSTAMSCRPSCQLIRLGVAREVGDAVTAEGPVVITQLATDTQPSVALGRAQDWTTGALDSGQGSIKAADRPDGLTLQINSLGSELSLQHAAIPSPAPALISRGFTVSDVQSVPGFDGRSIPVSKLDDLQIPMPRYTERVAVLDLETARRLGGHVDNAIADLELWLNADGLANVDTLISGLTEAGLAPVLVDRQSDHIASYGRSASALALQLTPIVGLASWALAVVVLLLMGTSSWRSRAQDYASLRINGVPEKTTGGAARWEHSGPVALAALLGAACGVVGAHIALPMFPLFADTSEPSPYPLELAINWPWAVILWLAGTLVLTATTLALGASVNRRSGYSRIREDLS